MPRRTIATWTNIDVNPTGDRMNDRIVTIHELPQLTARTRRAMLLCGLWMRAGFIGASAVVIGVIQLFDGGWSAVLALSTAGAGAALAVLSWHRAHAALGDADEPATVLDARPAAAHR